jgi:hypothetical protein
MVTKIVYNDNNKNKVMYGEVIAEDEIFIYVLNSYKGMQERVGRRSVISITEEKEE